MTHADKNKIKTIQLGISKQSEEQQSIFTGFLYKEKSVTGEVDS